MAGSRSTMSGLDSSHLNGLSDPTDLPALRAALAAEDPEGRLVPLGLDRVAVGPEVVGTVADAVVEQLARTGRPGTGPVVVLGRRDPDPASGRGPEGAGRSAAHGPVRGRAPRPARGPARTPPHAARRRRRPRRRHRSGRRRRGRRLGGRRHHHRHRQGRHGPTPDGRRGRGRHPARGGADRGLGRRLHRQRLGGAARRGEAHDPVALARRRRRRRHHDLQAPEQLNTAGYGEVLSMLTAPADWYLASVLGLDDDVPPGPARPAGRLRPRPRRVVAAASRRAIRRRSASSPGCSPCAAIATAASPGTTACLSGRRAPDQPHARHAQRRARPADRAARRAGRRRLGGGGCGLAAPVRRPRPGRRDRDTLFPDPTAVATRRRVLAAFADLDPSGAGRRGVLARLLRPS